MTTELKTRIEHAFDNRAALDAVAGRFGLDFQGLIDLRQGLRAVDSRLALPQQIQIWTVQDQKIRHSTLPKRTASFANLGGFV